MMCQTVPGGARPIVDAFLNQYARAVSMLRDAIARLTDQQWNVGGPTWAEVPSCAACHAIQCAEYYICDDRSAFRWDAHKWKAWEYPPRNMPTRGEAIAYLDRVAAMTVQWVRRQSDSKLLAVDPRLSDPPRSLLEELLYALRHLQHHTAHISQECKRRGFGASEWR
jgi:hypothetical protein